MMLKKKAKDKILVSIFFLSRIKSSEEIRSQEGKVEYEARLHRCEARRGKDLPKVECDARPLGGRVRLGGQEGAGCEHCLHENTVAGVKNKEEEEEGERDKDKEKEKAGYND
ncbi:hypothetical protein E2C01_077854 [Portunus trituberculatus]|uniref:Uncharacterized protein n=1 Tax=Portunus trituberculatus TaxID=210409 RepID=A0A5B7IR11_PORTR|nr:hypothetical protein [Portunus trituberculatus]